MARRQNGALTALIVADARLVRFRGSDQDGVRVAFASLAGVRFVGRGDGVGGHELSSPRRGESASDAIDAFPQ